MKRLLTTLLMSLGILTASVSVAPIASASSQGWVYIAFPKWLANCPNGGDVKGVLASVGNTWSTTSWDTGDDLVYAKVRLNSNQQVSYTLLCKKGLKTYYQPGFANTIKPTRNNQTVWVGPAGVRYN